MDPLARLQSGIDQAGTVISQIPREKYGLPTPCTEWNVGEVINHMSSALVMFRDVAEKGEADPALLMEDLLGDDAAKSLVSAGEAAVRGWSAPGKIDGIANLPFGELPAQFALQLPAMDMLVHSWDIATATGTHVDWDPELVADTWQFVEATFSDPQMREDDFAPPVEVPADSDLMSKVVAFLGRTP